MGQSGLIISNFGVSEQKMTNLARIVYQVQACQSCLARPFYSSNKCYN